ncbi:hypothetical protein D0Z07_6263 [Hyphodiscus hymeniophilus]|uniref:Uncharacterized protein n=1 Tax=Hyphodiscus hymeniophilus TaxID=353542 RepID=A0A9P6VFI7_9HELO|nr:hypothetical protein D0Z07_6263 [Hyphodiscus hymeniophilus]
MASSAKFLQVGIHAENEHLMSYSPYEDDEKLAKLDNSPDSNGRQLKSFTNSGLITLIASTALISVLLSGLGLHFLHILNPRQFSEASLPVPGTFFGSCGNTSSSARHAGCMFDIMSFSWLPLACADPELTVEFKHLRKWNWWLDENRTAAVPFEEVALGFHSELFVTREYHMYHCTYMWRKLHRGLLRGQENAEKRGIVDSYIGSYGHTAHCEMMLVGMEEDGGGIDKNATDTAILMKFPQCMWV